MVMMSLLLRKVVCFFIKGRQATTVAYGWGGRGGLKRAAPVESTFRDLFGGPHRTVTGRRGGGGYVPFLRDHLFVTKRVAVRDGNFLIGASFFSDRPRHLLFRPKKSVLGPLDLFLFI